MNKNNFFLYYASALLLFFPVALFAQPSPNLSYLTNFLIQFEGFLNNLVFVIMALATIFFLWGMMVFILNAGSEEKRSEGKKKMLWGIIILVVMVSIWGIVNLLSSVFLEAQPMEWCEYLYDMGTCPGSYCPIECGGTYDPNCGEVLC